MEKFGINVPSLMVQVVNYALLAYLLYKLLYKRLLATLDERKQRIAKAMADADAAREAAANAQLEYDRLLIEARRKAQEIVAEAAKRAELLTSESTIRVQQQAEVILAKAREQATAERAQILVESQGTIINLALAGAKRVLGAELVSPDRQRQLVMQYLDELYANQLN